MFTVNHLQQRLEYLSRYISAYRKYCQPFDGLQGIRIAPFHLLATAKKTYVDQPHSWHMQELGRLAEVNPLFIATDNITVPLANDEAIAGAVDWWLQRTEAGAEGMVVKPIDFITRRGKSLLQPAIKCRGREYLRIIYGPDYTLPANLTRLRDRKLTTKRRVALQEFALGIEALRRFVDGEPLWRVHHPVFGVLALESEPVDPRL